MLRNLLVLLPGVVLAACAATSIEPSPPPVAGVALSLAQQRASAVADVHYRLSLELPEQIEQQVTGVVTVEFQLLDASEPLVLDFRAPADNVHAVSLDDGAVEYSVVPDHIVIPASALNKGSHRLRIEFTSTNAALNRQPQFLYALFVPDRASTAFPVFEQPNIKAVFSLRLGIPAKWQALSNGELLNRDTRDTERHVLQFADTLPISTYLFSFAAGELQMETAVRNGREFTMYHRETDQQKLARNRDAIFDLHATALTWLEDYTGIAYPFGKFAFFAIPAFQFGGMEHPGAVWYRAETLFLDPTASRTQELSRASLIAHETAHMWFGDLVTMEWFNDVWMKEVFANFMAAKIAGPAFPDLNLDLRFFQAHHPTAYAVDRTAGTNAIRQQLDNLSDAGSLYGAIIYQKAPVVVQQLEELLGEELLRDGLRRYLAGHRYGNASWSDLINILDPLTDEDLAQWSEVWVAAAGRPHITAEWREGGIAVQQRDANSGRALLWNQPLVLGVQTAEGVSEHRVQLRAAEAFIPLADSTAPKFIFGGADGIGYGRFLLDAQSRGELLTAVHTLQNPVHRAVVWQTLWEELLDAKVTADQLLSALLIGLQRESDELIAQQLLGLLRQTWWQFMDADKRSAFSGQTEQVLWDALARAETPGRKGAWFDTLISVTLTEAGTDRLRRIWRGDDTVAGLPLQEQQFIDLAEALALRDPANAAAILQVQEQRLTNPDRLSRLRFMRPALEGSAQNHAALLASFNDVAVRRQESWVLDVMAAIHHPLRNESNLALLRPSLDLTAEIQRTGDIFFPLNWLNATLSGYQTPAAAQILQDYLAANPALPPRLRGKVLQAADDLQRAAAMTATIRY